MNLSCIILRQFEANEAAPQFFCHGERGAAAAERFKNGVARIGRDFDDSAEQLLGHLAAVPSRTLLERAADSREIPDVFFRLKTAGGVLRT